MATGIPARLSDQDARRFGLVVGAAFCLLGVLLWWRGRTVTPPVLGGIGVALIVLGGVSPRMLAPVHRAWMAAAAALSKVTTPLFLAVVYFGVLTPIGVLRRVFGEGRLAPRPRGDSFWLDRNGARQEREHMERQF